ncbi:MAG: DUF5320 domain-containing protein [Parcubacteria group bacterium]|nr:DUF5320 domain-containing protein [Parcubacteria group bacterium]
MPRLNKTGPQGQGPKTGRGLGSCAPDPKADRNFMRGFVFGCGCGRGFGRSWFSYNPTVKEEKEMLTDEAEILKEEIKEIQKRLEDLKKKK